MRTILLGLLVMAANPTPATPSVSSTDTVSISASQEALLLRQYTQVVANDHRVAYPAVENNTGGITLTQIIGEPRQVPGATQDPREFGFDPQQPWRPATAKGESNFVAPWPTRRFIETRFATQPW